MKQLIIFFLAIIISTGIYAQGGEQKIREKKMEFLKSRMELTEEQSASFWPEYQEFGRMKNNLRIALSQNRMELKKSGLSESEGRKVLEKEIGLKQQMIDLEKQYLDKYLKILSYQQVIELYRAEDEFNHIVMQRLKHRQDGGGPPAGRH